ncbi:sensor histidine kinase [Domibacillus indicus]|uniref:sensor histidine kinase n=1 Tax=Domibacillus indicus TaxID=1437523 RepID=UPI0006182ABD|nr:sensor histidine kinase [Domibacillus indicus]
MLKSYWQLGVYFALYIGSHIYLTYQMADGEYTFFSALAQFYGPGLLSLLSIILVLALAQRKTKSARRFILFLLAVSLSLFASQKSGEGDPIAAVIFMIAFQLAALYFLLFVQSILLKKQLKLHSLSSWLNAYKYATFLFIALNIACYFTLWLPKYIMGSGMLVHFSFSVISALGIIGWQYAKKENVEHQGFLKWMMIVPAIAFIPFIFLYALPYVISGAGLGRFDRVAVLSLFALPYGYTRLLVSRQLFDFDFVIGRFLYYSILSIIPAFLLAAVLEITGRFTASFAAALLILALTFLLKEQFDFSIRSSLFQDRNNLVQGIELLAGRFSAVMNTSELEKMFILEVMQSLKPSTVFIAERKEEKWSVRQQKGKGPSLLSDEQKMLMNRDRDQALLFNKQWLGIQLFERPGSKIYIWLGPKKNGLKWNISEKAWLLAALPYVRLVADNLQVVERKIEELEMQAINHSPGTLRLLLAISEKERRRLASDLHNSVLQEQFIVQRKLERLFRSENLETQLKQEVKNIQSDIKQITRHIQETCHELRPAFFEEEGLQRILQELFSKFKLSSDIDLQYDIDLPASTEINHDKELAVYRIVQELLVNAQKHSQASRLSISIWQEDETLFLDYLDNGVGFDSSQADEKKNQMGLLGIKERTAMLSGYVEWVTPPQRGVQVKITVPEWSG